MVYFNMLIQNSNQMNILVAKNSTMLKEVLKEADVKSLLNNLSNSQNKQLDLSNIFKQLFTQVKDNNQSNETILNLLKNSNLAKDLGSFTKTATQLLELIKGDGKLANLKTTLQNFLVDIKNVNASNVKEQIQNSGIFLESKLLAQIQNPKSNALNLNDLKAVLLKASESLSKEVVNDSSKSETLRQVDRLLNQIDFHQLYSLANNSNSVYVPFLWDMLEDGSIDIKKVSEEKFHCRIDLNLKELGLMDIDLFSFDKNGLDINFYIQKDETKQLLRKNFTKLKQALNGAEIKINSLEIYSMKEETVESKKSDIYKNNNLDFGVDIRV